MIIQNSRKEPFSSPRELRKATFLSTDISLSTVKRILRNAELFGRSAAKKPRLNKVQVTRRLQWCKDYKFLSLDELRKIIFSDESQIQMYSTRRVHVRRPINGRFLNRYVTKTVKFGGPSIMVWGAIKGDNTRILIRCPHRLDSLK